MSTIQLTPFINFQGRAREAVEFYQKVLGGELELQAGPNGRIGQARLEAEGVHIIATDGHPDYPAKVGENLALFLEGSDGPRLTGIFKALSQGGKVNMPLAKQPWGGQVGWLVDKFGISWSVNIQAKP
jgi:PhnB protein